MSNSVITYYHNAELSKCYVHDDKLTQKLSDSEFHTPTSEHST